MAIDPVPGDLNFVAPALTVRDAAGAIEFYKNIFGAVETMRLIDGDGRIAHAELKVGNGLIMLSDEFPDWGNKGPEAVGGTPVRLHLYVEDVDAVVERAVESGAQVLMPVEDQFYGDRAGRIADPFGHIWMLASRREQVSVEEMQKRYDDLLAGA